jgi:hypothetical protein
MQMQDLETYLTGNGFDSRMAPQVRDIVLAQHYIDLRDEPVDRLAVANDTVRMDIRRAAMQVFQLRTEVAAERKVGWDHLPFRQYPNWLQL